MYKRQLQYSCQRSICSCVSDTQNSKYIIPPPPHKRNLTNFLDFFTLVFSTNFVHFMCVCVCVCVSVRESTSFSRNVVFLFSKDIICRCISIIKNVFFVTLKQNWNQCIAEITLKCFHTQNSILLVCSVVDLRSLWFDLLFTDLSICGIF